MAGAAEAAGYRACLRCRPYRMVGSVPWEAPEMVCRAIQLIVAGALDDGNEQELGERLGLSGRHLRRLFHEHLGLTPDQFARSRRAHFARRLLDDTDLPVVDVAFAAGFGSLRQFNRAMREIFREPPTRLRERRRKADRLATDGGLELRLPVEGPYDWAGMCRFLGERAVPGVEVVEGLAYRRTVVIDGEPGVLEVFPGAEGELRLRAHLPYWEGVIHVVDRVRQMLALDVDGRAVTHLAGDFVLAPLVRRQPGRRVPGVWGPFEVGMYHLIRQHASREETRKRLGALAEAYGTRVPGLPSGLDRTFPSAAVIAEADPEGVGEFARAVADGRLRLDAGVSAEELTSVGGFGPVAAQHLAMRLGERDAFPAGDPVLRAAISRLAPDISDMPWRPWRALAATYLLAYAEGDD